MARRARTPRADAARLRDGTVILIRPLERGDTQQLVRAFERLSFQSRYRRFLTPVSRLNSHFLQYLADVDHHDHEALIAEASVRADPVGVARYIRLADHPDTAELAIAVVDDWQGKGAGTALLRRLTTRAAEEGVERFSATCLATNTDMLDLLEVIAPVRVRSMEDGVMEVEIALPAHGEDALRTALRRAASGTLLFRHPLEHTRGATTTDADART